MRSLKTAIRTNNPRSLEELGEVIDNFLLQFRNAIHPSTGKSPAFLFKGWNLRSSLSMDTTEVMFYRGNENRPCDGLLLSQLGNRMFEVMDRADGSVHRRHRDQVNLTPPRKQFTTQAVRDVSAEPSFTPPASSSPQDFGVPETSAEAQPTELREVHSSAPQADSPTGLDGAVEASPTLQRSQRTRKPPMRFQDFVV